jgi:hypothetical protein
VNLTSILDCTTGAELLPSVGGIGIIFDSGAPNMYLPTATADAVAKRLNATTHLGFAYVNCTFRERWEEGLDFAFAAGASGVPRIHVPVPELVYPYGAPSNIGEVKAADGTKLCYLGVRGGPGPIYLLGHTFLRSAYVVFDADALAISVAQAVVHK